MEDIRFHVLNGCTYLDLMRYHGIWPKITVFDSFISQLKSLGVNSTRKAWFPKYVKWVENLKRFYYRRKQNWIVGYFRLDNICFTKITEFDLHTLYIYTLYKHTCIYLRGSHKEVSLEPQPPLNLRRKSQT